MTLWMRWISFQKMRDLLRLIATFDGSLTADGIHRLGIQERILVHGSGRPFSRTTTYHYRMAMRHLGLANVSRGRYFLAKGRAHLRELATGSELGSPLTRLERLAFAEVVVRDRDCRHWFFDLFLGDSEADYDLRWWIEHASSVYVEGLPAHKVRGESQAPIILRNTATGQSGILDTTDKIQAILWGVRLWCTEQLDMVEELALPRNRYLLYPVGEPGSVDYLSVLRSILTQVNPEEGWTSLRVPDLMVEWGPRLRLRSRDLHEALLFLHRTHPRLVTLVASSMSFLTMTTRSERHRRTALKSYLRDPRGRYVSHIKLHRDIWGVLAKMSGEGLE